MVEDSEAPEAGQLSTVWTRSCKCIAKGSAL